MLFLNVNIYIPLIVAFHNNKMHVLKMQTWKITFNCGVRFLHFPRRRQNVELPAFAVVKMKTQISDTNVVHFVSRYFITLLYKQYTLFLVNLNYFLKNFLEGMFREKW